MKKETTEITELNVVNTEMQSDDNYDVGGAWACVIGCGTFCFMGGGYTSLIAAVATAL